MEQQLVRCYYCGVYKNEREVKYDQTFNITFCNNICQLAFYGHTLNGIGKVNKVPILAKK